MGSRSILSAALGLSLAAAFAQGAEGAWSSGLLFRGGAYSSVVFDSQKNPHISYLDGDSDPANYQLRRAWFDGRTWRSEVIEGGDVGWWSSIAIDAQDRLHVAYLGDGTGLRYARHDGAWTVTAVDPTAGYSNSITVDATGHPHIATVTGGGDVRYARFDGVSWRVDTVAAGAWYGGKASLGLDSDGAAHIAFTKDTLPREVHYATNADGSWEAEDVADGEFPSLALDASGRPSIVYTASGGSGPELRWARFDGLDWLDGKIADGLYDWPAAIYGPDGILHVAVGGNNGTEQNLSYASYDGVWSLEQVRGRNVGFEPSIALDRLALPFIACRAAGRNDTSALLVALRVKGETGGVWESVTTTQTAAKQIVKGKFRAGNEGTAPAKKLTVRIFLSDDGVLDAGDTQVGKSRKIPVLNPGRSVAVRVNYKTKVSASGKYLIASVQVSDPANEVDPSDNEIAAQIP